MNSALFHYRRRFVVTVNGVETEKFNDNFINPLNVTSFYWTENADAKPILNVYLNAVRTIGSGTNAFSITFGDTVGKRFVDHMEDFLRYQLGWGRTSQASPHRTSSNESGGAKPRNARREIEVIEEVETATDVQVVG